MALSLICPIYSCRFRALVSGLYFGIRVSGLDTGYGIRDTRLDWFITASRTNQAATTHTNKLAYALKSFFESSEIKAALLLGSLPDSMNNIVENLQTKDNLTYELAYNHLMDLRSSSSTAPPAETVLKASSTQPSKDSTQDSADI